MQLAAAGDWVIWVSHALDWVGLVWVVFFGAMVALAVTCEAWRKFGPKLPSFEEAQWIRYRAYLRRGLEEMEARGEFIWKPRNRR